MRFLPFAAAAALALAVAPANAGETYKIRLSGQGDGSYLIYHTNRKSNYWTGAGSWYDHETEVGAFYWTALAPEIVNSGREEQGSVS
jgi:hypothetical protein